MATVIGYLLVEGVHDLAVVQKILDQRQAFTEITSDRELKRHLPNSDWERRLVHRGWPVGDDLDKRHPVPKFVIDDTREKIIVLDVAEGDDAKLNERLSVVRSWVTSFQNVCAWGIVLDSDRLAPPDRLRALRTLIPTLPDVAGARGVVTGPPRVGVHIMPNNQSLGTLENALLEAGRMVYPKTIAKAQAYIAAVTADQDDWANNEWRGMRKPSGPDKATIAAITAILKPGRTTQVSIKDHAWITDDTIANTDLKHLDDFLTALFFT